MGGGVIQQYRNRNVRFLTLSYFELTIIRHANATILSYLRVVVMDIIMYRYYYPVNQK